MKKTTRWMKRPEMRLLILTGLLLILGPGIARAGEAITGKVAVTPREEIWQKRNSPEAVDAAAKALLGQLVLDDLQQQYTGLPFRTEFMEAAKLAKEGKAAEAARVFERYFLNKLRSPNAYGLLTEYVSAYAYNVGMHHLPPLLSTGRPLKIILEQANDLMEGTVLIGGKKTVIGAPGTVNWRLPLKPDQPIIQDPAHGADPRPYNELSFFYAFNPLVEAYLATKDERYLQRWVDYLDDWALNCDYLDEIHPCFGPSGIQDVPTLQFARLFGTLALAMPSDREIIPPQVFARVLAKIVPYPLLLVVYIRSNVHNWTPHMDTMLTSLIYDEFKSASFFFREGRRRNIEDMTVTQNLRDGGENQQCLWYNYNYLNVAAAFRMLDARSSFFPSWKELPWVNELRRDPVWRAEHQEHLRERLRMLIHMRTQQNEYPLGLTGVGKTGAAAMPGEDGRGVAIAPEVYAEPDNARIIAAVRGIPFSQPPSFTDEWFPYAGYNIVRTGWSRDDGYGLLFCSPKPGSYGGFRSRSNNNFFGLNAFGSDLLMDETTHPYHPASSPISVDEKMQYFPAGVCFAPSISNHKKNMSAAWTEPADWRWHASESFNLMEGVYSGPYAKDYNAWSLPLSETLQGIVHQRLALFARKHGLWIVTDRLRNPDSHAYEQIWRLPIKPCANINAFEPEDIKIDAASQTIRTMSQGETSIRGVIHKQPNITLCHIAPMKLEYTVKNEPRNTSFAMGWQRIGAKWTGKGDQQLITAILPRRPGAGPEGDLKDVQKIITEKGVSGFDAQTPDGGQVQYRAALNRNGEALAIGPVKMRGEALLLLREGKQASGMALGCTEMTINGQPVNSASPDFEFSIPSATNLSLSSALLAIIRRTKDEYSTIPIYRPISPVRIIPDDRNVFVDSLKITMQSKTPGVEIRYTLDGADPTPRSALYTGPVVIAHSTIVKARAYRPGLKENPVVMSGTHATVPSMAVFTRAEPLAVAKEQTSLKPGLNCNYFEGDWKQLWLGLDQVKPLKTAVVPKLFDLGMVPAENPPLGQAAAPRAKTYALQYNGYFLAPEDGVYTFHAPRELVMPDIDAGYELQLYLGDKVVPWGWYAQTVGLNNWYPSTRLHAFGNWSIALKKGTHRFQLFYLDYRTNAAQLLNQPGLTKYIWDGEAPDLRVTGAGIERQPIPAAWLAH